MSDDEFRRIDSPAFFIGKGDDSLISFGSGQPDLPPPGSAYRALQEYRGFKYGLVQGDYVLREAVSREYPNTHADEFVITNGASEALDLVLRSLAIPGGTVALPRPYYYSYPRNVILAGMTPVYYDLDYNGKIDFDLFVQVAATARVVLINSPSNPTGTVQDIDTLKKIESFCEERGIYVISDEVYKDLIYVRENYPLRGKRVITINSFSKTYAMCGYRVGYLHTHDTELLERVVEMKSHTAMNTSTVGQAMALAAMSEHDTYVAAHVPIWRERRDMIYTGMKELGLDVWQPEGAFYVFPKIENATDAMHTLFYKYRMITYSGEWFGNPNRLRFSYALTTEKIAEGLRRLKQFLEEQPTPATHSKHPADVHGMQ